MASNSPAFIVAREEFTLFPKLALELRLKIWRASLPGPRVVRINYNIDIEECRSSTPFPSALQTCQESRNEALRFYKLSFGPLTDENKTEIAEAPAETPEGRIYFEFNIDTFFILPKVPFRSEYQSVGPGQDDPQFADAELEQQRILGKTLTEVRRFLTMVQTTAHLEKVRNLGVRFDLLILLLNLLAEAFATLGEQVRAQCEWYKRFSPDCVGHLLLYAVGEEILAEDTLDFNTLDFEADDSGGGNHRISPDEIAEMAQEVRNGLKKANETTGLKWCAVQLKSDPVER